MVGQITEQLSPLVVKTKEDHLLYLRHHVPYIITAISFGNRSGICYDVGCGMGYGCFTMGRKFRSVVGVDSDGGSIKESSSTYTPHNPHVRFKKISNKGLDLPERSAGVVTSFQVIEHVENSDAFVSSVHKLLAKEGCAIFTTPNRELRLHDHEKPWNRFHRTEYTMNAFRVLLEKKHKNEGIIEPKFDYVDVVGITGIDEAMEVELARIKRVRELVKKDKLKLHRRLPLFLYNPLASIVVKSLPKKEEGAYGFKFEENIFFLTKDASRSIDLLAFCTDSKKTFGKWLKIKKKFMKPKWDMRL